MSGEQMDQVDRVELLSWLETIERNFDPLLLKGRNRFNEAEGWVGIWLFRSLIGKRQIAPTCQSDEGYDTLVYD